MDVLGSSLQFGRLSLPVWIIAGLVFYIAGRISLLFVFAKRPRLRGDSRELMANALLIGMLGWKVSPLIVSLQTVIDEPLSLLYVPGGIYGTLFGVLAAFVYLSVKLYRKPVTPRLFLKPLSVYTAAGILAVFVFSAALGAYRSSGNRFGSENGAPEFLLASVNGPDMGLSATEGQATIINFWASWCPPCRAEIPELKRFAAGLSGDDVRFISVNLTGSEVSTTAVETFVKREQIDYPVLLDVRNSVANAYGIRVLPTTVVVNPDGSIRSVKTGAVSFSWLKSIGD